MLQQGQQGLVHGLELAAPGGGGPPPAGPAHTAPAPCFPKARYPVPRTGGGRWGCSDSNREWPGAAPPRRRAWRPGVGEDAAAALLGGLELAQELHLVAHGVQHRQVGGQERRSLA